ncbi:MAG: DNA gyrase subunit A [Nitrospina sp.]|jgi:DNA gyrase subunit A|nr:DNA gyrase subunit A [Nitrospina sp.]MBT3509238.1 DNA gyrase subunit A [Nitrospina sp.]MBT3877189.1 DNA gyrase subunit A [Nitrospina sp.]MBT4048092.1 DNA gyrase subunit A [Nitrospina sp.]MBT4559202.1 DNA gyrase subunit A [Nitrospina sp.]
MPETIDQINIDDEMKSSYLDYAMSVIIGRALPDVRDGLKPVHRRALFAMHETGNVSNKPYKKSARIVGDVMGKYHPHGDQAIYDTIVRMAQEFSLRYPLVDGQGNFGSIDGDSAAAMRYTEIRMEEITAELLRDLEKDTVQFIPNYDDSLEEPSVLPASFPNLLVNGSSGIAVGMATNIPPHNLSEVIDSAIYVIENPDCSVEDLIEIVPGPDFPTRGVILGRNGIRSAYRTGRGIIRVRGRAEIEPMEKGDRERIIINELPYQVNKAKLVEKIAELVRDKRLEGISDLRDESDRDGIRVVVELKKGVMGQVVLNSIYKNTQLQDTFGVILLALVNQQPRILNLKEFLHYFILFRKEVVTRRTEFDLKKAREKEHILEGLATALDNLDAVVQLIRNAEDPATARDGLMTEFGLSEIQAKAILEMRLQRLTGLERQKIIEDLEETRNRIKELLNILAHEEVKLNIIKEELTEIRNKYSNERRTEIVDTDEGDIDIEDLIADEDVVVVYTRSGYIKRQTVDNYRAQRRGGKGIRGMNLKEEDVVEKLFIASTLSHLLVFTSTGKIHWLRVFSIPDVSRIAKGKSIANLLRLQPGESIASILSVREFEEDKFVMIATERGIVKKTSLMAYSKPRQGGIIGLTIDEGDRVIGAELCDGESDILLATAKGFSIRFSEKEVRPIGRTGRGVRGIRLKKEDEVVGAEIVHPGNKLLTVTSRGYGKRTQMEEYPVQGRGGLGVMTIRCNEKIGTVVGVQQVDESDQLLVITSDGNIVRMRVNEISLIGRNTQGVRLVGIGEGNQVVSIEKLVE